MQKWRALGDKLGGQLAPHTVRSEVLSRLELREQVLLAAGSAVMVALAGGGASTALWLPRGATLILLSPVDVKDDFVMWAHMSHIDVQWIEIGDLNSPPPFEALLRLVRKGLQRFAEHTNEPEA